MSVEQSGLEARFLAPGPKRILALDGAGVGMMLSAGLLGAAEAQLRRLSGRTNFRLCEYFDLIGASSTGALLAAPLALGATAAEAGNMAAEAIAQCFLPDQSPGAPRFDVASLDAFLAEVFGDKNIRGPALKTGLAIFARRADASGFTTFCNAPVSPGAAAGGVTAPQDIMVRSAIRASIGAPVSYEAAPVLHDPAGEDWAYYTDAAAAGLGNPSLSLLRIVALGAQGFEWHTGPDRILMLSIGDGASTGRVEGDPRLAALDAAMRDAKEDVVATLQSLSSVARLWRQHVPEGGFRATLSPVPLLHFQRMDLSFDAEALAPFSAVAEDFHVMAMTAAPQAMERLRDLGVRAGRQYFDPGVDKKRGRWDRAIFPRRFDLAGFTGGPREAPRNKLEALGRAWDEKAGSIK